MKDVDSTCNGIRHFPLYGDAVTPLFISLGGRRTGDRASAGENSLDGQGEGRLVFGSRSVKQHVSISPHLP